MRDPIQVALFDVGGVLVEFAGVPAMQAWLNHRVSPDELWTAWLRSPAVRAFESGSSATALPSSSSARCSSPSTAAFLAAFAEWPRRMYPGAVDLVRQLPAHVTRATIHWPRLYTEFGLGALFEQHFASHLTGRLKPDPEVFQHVADTLGCSPKRIVLLDDNRLNVEGAQAAGMRAAQVRGVEEARRALGEFGVLPA